MMNLQSQSDLQGYDQPYQMMQRIPSPQPVLNLRQQSADVNPHQPVARTLNPEEFSVAESALLLGAFFALVTSILSFTAL